MASIPQIIEDAIENYLNSINTSLPARVVRVDNTKAQCDVQPVIKNKYADDSVVEMPVITNVPIAFYRAGKAAVFIPVHVGDFVELRFAQRSLDLWLAKGGVVDPLDYRKFHIKDAIAYPGVYPFSDAPVGASDTDVVVINEQSKVTVKPNGEIVLEGSAIKALADLVVLSGDSDAIALASKVMTELNAIKSAFDSHTHLYAPGPGSPAPTAAPATPMPAPQDVKSDKVKAQ